MFPVICFCWSRLQKQQYRCPDIGSPSKSFLLFSDVNYNKKLEDLSWFERPLWTTAGQKTEDDVSLVISEAVVWSISLRAWICWIKYKIVIKWIESCYIYCSASHNFSFLFNWHYVWHLLPPEQPCWKHQFPFEHWSWETLGQGSTRMGDRMGAPGCCCLEGCGHCWIQPSTGGWKVQMSCLGWAYPSITVITSGDKYC